MKKTIILWDFDGTLAYRDGMWTASLSAVLEANGYKDYDRSLISSSMQPHYPWAKHEMAHNEYFNNLSWWEYIEENVVGCALSSIGISGSEKIKLAKQFKAEYLKLEMWYLFDDTIRNLEKSVEMGFNNAILSNHTPELKVIADYLDISGFFDHIITSAEIGYEKPNSKFFDVIKTFDYYDRFVMIGDNYCADVMGAKDYGLDAILVRKTNIMDYHKYSIGLDGIWEYI